LTICQPVCAVLSRMVGTVAVRIPPPPFSRHQRTKNTTAVVFEREQLVLHGDLLLVSPVRTQHTQRWRWVTRSVVRWCTRCIQLAVSPEWCGGDVAFCVSRWCTQRHDCNGTFNGNQSESLCTQPQSIKPIKNALLNSLPPNHPLCAAFSTALPCTHARTTFARTRAPTHSHRACA
jgi:hypothetical protein